MGFVMFRSPIRSKRHARTESNGEQAVKPALPVPETVSGKYYEYYGNVELGEVGQKGTLCGKMYHCSLLLYKVATLALRLCFVIVQGDWLEGSGESR